MVVAFIFSLNLIVLYSSILNRSKTGIIMNKNALTHSFYSGTSGLVLPFNKAQFPIEFKDKSRMQYYASLYNSLEINSSFYKLPKTTTVQNWSESVPQDFRFTFKAPKWITHVKNLEFKLQDLTDFMTIMEHVGDKKACLLIQFPPSLTIEQINPLKELLGAFSQITTLDSWKIAVEFRHPSWYEDQVHDLLKTFNASMVLHDMHNCATPWESTNNDFIYLRFHGPEPRYRGNYSADFLNQRGDAIKRWLSENRTVYAYFNNTLGAALMNLHTLNNCVHS